MTDIEPDMEETFVVNMDDVETFDNTAVPAGWYRCIVRQWSVEQEVKNKGGKIPQGTKGTQFVFEVVEDEANDGKYIGRRFWANYWHHPITAGFFKSLYQASGAFDPEELAGQQDLLGMRDRVVNAELWVKVTVQKATDRYDASNNVKGFKSLEDYEPVGGSASSIDDVMP